MKDGILHGLLCDGQAAVEIISARDTVARAGEIHNASPEVTAALGRALMGASLMCGRLKGEKERLSLTFKGDGPAGSIIAVAGSSGVLKGYAAHPGARAGFRPDGKLNVGGAVGKNGTLTVARDSGTGEPYVGVSELVSGEIAEDIARYYYISEQQPSAVLLGVGFERAQVVSAGGILIAPLPGCTQSALEQIETTLSRLRPVSELAGYYQSLEEFLHDSFWEIGARSLEEKEVFYNCDCSRERMLEALFALPKSDREELAAQEEIEMCCQFCGSKYIIKADELE